eukprot:5595781-Pyramimonas_sp.AAC.1
MDSRESGRVRRTARRIRAAGIYPIIVVFVGIGSHLVATAGRGSKVSCDVRRCSARPTDQGTP